MSAVNRLHDTDIIPASSMVRVVGDGANTRFWKDTWCGDLSFSARFSRLMALALDQDGVVSEYRENHSWSFRWRREIRGGEEENQLVNLMARLDLVSLLDRPDTWGWNLGTSDEFTVRSIRRFIDEYRLPVGGCPTRWNRCLPIKINVFMWRVMLERLPCRVPLVFLGIKNTEVRAYRTDPG